ncbi:MAG: DUF3461 family protein [Motiliproteus sp.]
MSRFATLTAMGVSSFDQISRYTLHSAGGAEILKIYYQRPDDSVLPRTKKFQIPLLDGGGGRSQVLIDAIAELDTLAGSQIAPEQARQQLSSELDELKQVMLAKMTELQHRLEHWG